MSLRSGLAVVVCVAAMVGAAAPAQAADRRDQPGVLNVQTVPGDPGCAGSRGRSHRGNQSTRPSQAPGSQVHRSVDPVPRARVTSGPPPEGDFRQAPRRPGARSHRSAGGSRASHVPAGQVRLLQSHWWRCRHATHQPAPAAQQHGGDHQAAGCGVERAAVGAREPDSAGARRPRLQGHLLGRRPDGRERCRGGQPCRAPLRAEQHHHLDGKAAVLPGGRRGSRRPLRLPDRSGSQRGRAGRQASAGQSCAMAASACPCFREGATRWSCPAAEPRSGVR